MLRILRILNMSCLLMLGFQLFLKYYYSRNSNLCDILSVLIPFPYPYPYPQFFDRSIPVLTPYHIFKKIQYPYPYPYRFFEIIPVSVLSPYPKFQILPVLRTLSVPVLGYGYGKSTESVLLHRGRSWPYLFVLTLFYRSFRE